MSDPDTRDGLEFLLRKLLLGEELVNTQFHLFSARSLTSGRITQSRVICAHNDLLSKNSKYFLDLLSSDVDAADPTLSELIDGNDAPKDCLVEDYGYGSDSDLDDYDDAIPGGSKGQNATLSTLPSSKGDDEVSIDSEIFVMSSEHPSTDDEAPQSKDEAGLPTSSDRVVPETRDQNKNKPSANSTAVRLRSLSSRHVLVRDTAFLTWYCLLNYLSTGSVDFLPLTSAVVPTGRPRGSSSSISALSDVKCSAKSMYRLACKVGLDRLRDKALAHIQSNLSEHNILKEISCGIISRHPQLLEMELDVLYSRIASPPVVTNFPALVHRIVNKELPHGADIILKVHEKFMRQLRPSSLAPAPRPPPPSVPFPFSQPVDPIPGPHTFPFQPPEEHLVPAPCSPPPPLPFSFSRPVDSISVPLFAFQPPKEDLTPF